MLSRLHLTPVRLSVLSFLALIVVGTVLLMLPFATRGIEPASLVDAFFTATSAVCVTGLIVKDTATYFSTFGQAVILVLIQFGGLGIMTLYASIPVIFGQQLRLSQRRMFNAIFDVENYASLRNMVRTIVQYAFVIEFIGAVILSARFFFLWGDWGKAIYHGVFHSISAFCNAGFMLFTGGMLEFRNDVVVNLVIIGLIILGGIGFVVIHQMVNVRSFNKLTSNAKLAVVMTILLLLIPSFLVFHTEFSRALGGMGILEKSIVTLMHVTSTRTAGFNTVDISTFGNATLFLFCILMFIGASPGGTGGGVKTTTIGLMILSIRSIFRGQADIECFGRKVPRDVITRSIAIIAVGFSAITVCIIGLMMIEKAGFLPVFFEVISAFNTVGLSLGLTGSLSTVGKLLICVMMFAGRIGTLSLILLLGGEEKTPTYAYPVGRFMVG